MRTCSKCGESLPETAEYFHRHGAGLRPDCKRCRSRKQAEYYVKNSDRIQATHRIWRDANPDKILDWDRRYRAKNRDRINAYKRGWRKLNLDKAAASMRYWRARNRERANAIDRAFRERTRPIRRQQAAVIRSANRVRYRAYTSRRRAMVRNAKGTYTTADIDHLHQLQGGRCRWCSVVLTDRFEIDHIIPLSRGGSNGPDNLAITCPTCNRHKSSLFVFDEWTPPHPLAL